MTGLPDPLHLLIIDDDDVDRERVCRLLARTGLNLRVTEVGSGAQAIELLVIHHFDCVLLDSYLSDASGVEMLLRLRAALPVHRPIIMVTGVGNEWLAARTMREGASDYLVKATLNSEELRQSLLRCQETARLKTEVDGLRQRLEQQVKEQALALRRREQDLEALVEHSPAAMGCWDMAQRCRFANRMQASWFNRPPEALAGMQLSDLLGPALHQQARPRIEAVMRGQAQSFEMQIPRAVDALPRFVQVLMRADRGAQGEMQGFYMTMYDVSDIRQMQAKAEELLRFSQSVIGNSPFGIALLDSSGQSLLNNAAFVEVFSEQAGVLSLAGGWNRPSWIDSGLSRAALRVLAQGGVDHVKIDLPVRGGEAARLACALARVDGGGESHLLLIAQDVSEQHRAHQALVAARDAAESAARAKSAFLANMSHEIRTPMNAIVGLSRLALEDEGLAPQARNYLTKAHGAAEALMGILDDVLDQAKIDAGQLHFECVEFVLEDLLQRSLDLFVPRAEQAGLALRVDLAPDLPSRFLGDPLRLSQILNNLLGNAIKFTEFGEVQLSICLDQSAALEEGRVGLCFKVTDTGVGLDEAQCGVLFQPFVQADDSVTRRFGGTGLGLSLCKQLSLKMHGDIHVFSVPGVGSQFWFTVVLDLAPEEASLAAASELWGRRLALLTRQSHLGQSFEAQLRAWQMEVRCFECAESVCEALLKSAMGGGEAFDFLIIDGEGLLGQEERQGLLELRQLAVDDRRLPEAPCAFLLSELERRTLLDTGLLFATDLVLEKPVLPSRLRALLRHRLRRSDDRVPSVSMAAMTAAAHLAALSELARPLSGLKILLAEDNELNQIVAKESLSRLGLEVEVVDDGSAALAAVSRDLDESFAAILMDMHMPGLDGLEATRQLRRMEVGVDIPVIGLTAAALAEDRANCIEAGMDDHLTKPLNPEQVIRALLKWVAPHRLRRDAPLDAEHPLRRKGDRALRRADVDIVAARRRLSGDASLLHKLLSGFVSAEADAHGKLSLMLDQQDFVALRRKAHSLKCTAFSLGANDIALAAAGLESAVVSRGDMGEALMELQWALEADLRVIQQALSAEPMC
jgi:signal transduction histidine kinase/CheY-like chemotaxis protein/HPt (histidine-containing phosphotransfer) domain-containing protein